MWPWELTQREHGWGKVTTLEGAKDSIVLTPEAFCVWVSAIEASEKATGGIAAAVDASGTTPQDRSILAGMGLSATTDRQGSPMMAVSQRKRVALIRAKLWHRKSIKAAIIKGKTVSPDVLAEYGW